MSEDTLKRWEDPESNSIPLSADVSRMERVYHAPGLWYSWMYSNDEGFRDHFPAVGVDHSQALAIVNVRHQIADVLALQDLIERDAMDGRMDDAAACKAYLSELDDMQAAIAQAKERIKYQSSKTEKERK